MESWKFDPRCPKVIVTKIYLDNYFGDLYQYAKSHHNMITPFHSAYIEQEAPLPRRAQRVRHA